MQMDELRTKSLNEERMVFWEAQAIHHDKALVGNTFQYLLAKPPLPLRAVDFVSDVLTTHAIRIFSASSDLLVDDEAEPSIGKARSIENTCGRGLPGADPAADPDYHAGLSVSH